METAPQPTTQYVETTAANRALAEAEKAKGNDEFKRKNFQNAIAFYDKASELDRNEAIYLNNKAACYIELKDYEKAIQVCDQAVEILKDKNFDNTKLAKVFARKASAFVHLKQNRQALDCYNQSLTKNNDNKVREDAMRLAKLIEETEVQDQICYEITQNGIGRLFYNTKTYGLYAKELCNNSAVVMFGKKGIVLIHQKDPISEETYQREADAIELTAWEIILGLGADFDVLKRLKKIPALVGKFQAKKRSDFVTVTHYNIVDTRGHPTDIKKPLENEQRTKALENVDVPAGTEVIEGDLQYDGKTQL